MEFETAVKPEELEKLAHAVYAPENLAAPRFEWIIPNRWYDRGSLLHEEPRDDCILIE